MSIYPEEAGHPPEFWAELAYSQVHFLRQHAIPLSLLEERPLSGYVDPDAIKADSLLYSAPHTPAIDLLRTQSKIVSIWRQYYRAQSSWIRSRRSLSAKDNT
jgi:hypothetical protein